MKEINKYYTPDIEEFHIGFEFEIEDLHDNLVDRCFRPTVADWGEVDLVMDDWEHKNKDFSKTYRVKYLDKEDIESLGFIQDIKNEDKYKLFDESGGWITLYFDSLTRGPDQGIGILIFDLNQIFSGYIKNKSELKKLLKQLNIK